MPKEHSSWLPVVKHFQKPGDKTTSSLLCTSCRHPTCAGVQSAAEPRLRSLRWSAPLSSSAVSTEQSIFPQHPLWSTGAPWGRRTSRHDAKQSNISSSNLLSKGSSEKHLDKTNATISFPGAHKKPVGGPGCAWGPIPIAVH